MTIPPGRIATQIRAGLPLLLFGLRLWAAVCLALYLAFWLELENPSWAGTTAAIVCQPVLGASLRKGWFRMIGTVIGAIVSLLIAAAFPQSRTGFLITLTLWSGLCGFLASVLRNFAAYAAALAGYSAVIICIEMLGSVAAGSPNATFDFAIARATEIGIGIASAGIVLAGTDIGRARGQLAIVIATLVGEITTGLANALSQPASAQERFRPIRRALIARVANLDTLIDAVLGESPSLRFHPRSLQAGTDGLVNALSGWRGVSTHIERQPALAEPAAPAILRQIRAIMPPIPDPASPDPNSWVTNAASLRQGAIRAARSLVGTSFKTPSTRMLANQTAIALLGLGRALRAIVVLRDPARVDPRPGVARLRVPDLLPPVVNALRVILAMAAAEVVWIGTAWPSGGTVVIFAAITVILFSPREDAAFDTARGFMLGTTITAILAGLIEFFVLPSQQTFLGFSLVCAVVLIPAGALSAGTWQSGLFLAMAANFIPLLGPSNPMVFDLAAFLNTAVALVTGLGLAVISLRLLPPLPPLMRSRRLVALTLRDVRRLAARPDAALHRGVAKPCLWPPDRAAGPSLHPSGRAACRGPGARFRTDPSPPQSGPPQHPGGHSGRVQRHRKRRRRGGGARAAAT